MADWSPEKTAALKTCVIKGIAHGLSLTAVCAEMAKTPEWTVSRMTVYHWRHIDPEFDKACEVAEQSYIRVVEEKLFELVEKGSTRAVTFFLTNRAKNKWQDKQVVENIGTQKEPQEIHLVLDHTQPAMPTEPPPASPETPSAPITPEAGPSTIPPTQTA